MRQEEDFDANLAGDDGRKYRRVQGALGSRTDTRHREAGRPEGHPSNPGAGPKTARLGIPPRLQTAPREDARETP